MRKTIRIVAAAVAPFLAGGSLLAHHSFAGSFDGTKLVRLEGVIVKVDWVNPHSFIYLEVTGANGTLERWALEGPSGVQLNRRGIEQATFKPGERLEACGYGARDGSDPLVRDSAKLLTARRMSAELLVRPDGQRLIWSNYGQRKCLDS